VPFLFVYSDALLMRGPAYEIALDVTTAVVGVWLISAAIMGYSVRQLRIADRALYFIAGFFLMLPSQSFVGARWFNIAGAVIAVLILAWERMRHRSAAPAT
jgi:TRAP-type uncharacterized transport system fused permease subunit